MATIKINRKNFRLAPKEDRAILLACIGIAFVFWLLIKLSQTYVAEKDIVFSIQTPSDQVLSSLPPQYITARLEGTGWDLMFDYFSARRLELQYDMSGLQQLTVSSSQLQKDVKQQLYSDDIQILELRQEELTLQLEKKASKKVPVVSVADLSFAPEHQLKSPIALQPDSIVLAGPASVLETYSFWQTDSIKLRNLHQSRNKAVPLAPTPPELSLSVQKVTAIIEVEPITEKSVYAPLVVKNAPDSLRIFPDKVTVVFKLGLSKYDQTSYRDFKAEVDLSGISVNSPNNTVPIELTERPDYVKSLYFTPKAAKFFIVESAEKETE